jgi:hypothetical protein
MNPSFFVGLLLAIPLSMIANLLTPKVSRWWTNRDAERKKRRIVKLEKELRLLRGPSDKPPDSYPIVRVGHSPPIAGLFKGSDHWTTVAYTCRATPTEEQYLPIGPTGKAHWTHVPVDEIQTLSVVINHLMPAAFIPDEDDMIHTVVCSKSAEQVLFWPVGEADLPDGIPPLYNRDLIVVGENNLSNTLLAMVQCYLPWQAGTGRIIPQGGSPRPAVDVNLVSRFNRRAIATKRDVRKGGGMIVLIPNPLNVHKRVLIFFGCHREGQFALQNWLSSREAAEVIEEVHRSDRSGCSALQILVDQEFAPPANMRGPGSVKAIKNLEDNKHFWITKLHTEEMGDKADGDTNDSVSHELYDISLVVPLPPNIKEEFISRAPELQRIPDLDWENEEPGIGFHITLYEFLHHDRPDAYLQNQLSDLLRQLCDVLKGEKKNNLPGGIKARVRGFEFLATAVVSYVDFLDENGRCCSWLDRMRNWCEGSIDRAELAQRDKELLNAMRVPFPVHVTLCRFSRILRKSEQSSLIRIADEWRNQELMRFPLTSASLTVAMKSPYREVKKIETFQF